MLRPDESATLRVPEDRNGERLCRTGQSQRQLASHRVGGICARILRHRKFWLRAGHRLYGKKRIIDRSMPLGQGPDNHRANCSW